MSVALNYPPETTLIDLAKKANRQGMYLSHVWPGNQIEFVPFGRLSQSAIKRRARITEIQKRLNQKLKQRGEGNA